MTDKQEIFRKSALSRRGRQSTFDIATRTCGGFAVSVWQDCNKCWAWTVQFGNTDAHKFRPKANHAIWAKRHALGSNFGNTISPRNCPHEIRRYDFTRNPIVENQTFFLESKCVHCGLVLLAGSLEELVEEEKGHRAQCAPSSAAHLSALCAEKARKATH